MSDYYYYYSASLDPIADGEDASCPSQETHPAVGPLVLATSFLHFLLYSSFVCLKNIPRTKTEFRQTRVADANGVNAASVSAADDRLTGTGHRNDAGYDQSNIGAEDADDRRRYVERKDRLLDGTCVALRNDG